MVHDAPKVTREEVPAEYDDPGLPQRMAAFPGASSWVAASAGTGKTKVLSDRVLRLLLPREGGEPGTPAHKILCITYTRAGAGEMAQRITGRLSSWAVMSEGELREDLNKNLLGREPSEEECLEARRLFASVLDCPGGLKIMTIHAFCQSVLKRFPLEAGISPHSELAEEAEAEELLSLSLRKVISRAKSENASELHMALERLAAEQNEEQLSALLKNICGERKQLQELEKKYWNAQGLHAALCDLMGVSPADGEDELVSKACLDESFDMAGLRAACAALADYGTLPEGGKSQAIQKWLDNPGKRPEDFYEYCRQFLTKDNVPFKRTVTAKVAANSPESESCLQTEAERLVRVIEKCKEVRCAAATRDLFALGIEVAKEYAAIKEIRGLLDYDDLIMHTLALLEQNALWVMFKLDQGVDHLLIDEAQDTNPEQWMIAKLLWDEVLAGKGSREDITRTLFTVGDIKQSIYSFQRAAPDRFLKMHRYFSNGARKSGMEFRDIPLDTSFRSVETVLRLVDETFSDPEVAHCLGPDYRKHISYRKGQAGTTEIWPLFEGDEREEKTPWLPPTEGKNSSGGPARLAAHVAATIRKWLDAGEELPSRGRAVEAGDILILVRTRSAFVGQLMRELKLRDVPVSGIDRMVLKDQLAVQDLLGVAQFALQPEDDLNLAAILKSPLIGINEERLYELAAGRKGSLWQSVKRSAENAVSEYLEAVIKAGSSMPPYEFLSNLVHGPCPADPHGSGIRAMRRRLGSEIIDPIEELLADALNYDRHEAPSLQGFVQQQTASSREIKREQEESGGQVRIMTVHGAKGLQAPVVILPDTVRTKSGVKDQRILWPYKTGIDVPLWSARKDDDPEFFRAYLDNVREAGEEEYMRLLYVAMTRAEDRLYVGGATGKQKGKSDPESWYFFMENAFKRLVAEPCPQGGAMSISDPQTAEADRSKEKNTAPGRQPVELPQWALTIAPEEPDPPKPVSPSRPSAEAPAVSSPLSEGDDGYRFRRGNVTHKLLQFLPDTEPEDRLAAAGEFTAQPGHGLPESVCAEIAAEVTAILDNPDFAPLFAPGSMAEVPVTGLLPDGRAVSGQVDRLAVTEEEVLIVDYKTNRPPPPGEEGVPFIYLEQMRAYRDILRQVYRERRIRCFILWTDGPRLTELVKSLTD